MVIKQRSKVNIHCRTCKNYQLCLPRDISDDSIDSLNSIIKNVYMITKNDHVYRQNDKLNNLYAIHSGYCKEYWIDQDGNEHITGFYYPGDILGLESLPYKKHAFFCSALKDLQLCVIPLKDLFMLMSSHSSILHRYIDINCYKMINNIHVRIQTSARARIANFLLNTSLRQLEEHDYSTSHVLLPMSQIDISNFLGMAFETVNRILHDLKKDNIVADNSKQIIVSDLRKLRDICDAVEYYGQVDNEIIA